MKNTEFGTAVWGFDWNDPFEESAVQGVANLTDDGVVLDIPFGCLLEGEMTEIVGGLPRRPREAEYLYGFTQAGDWLVLTDCFQLAASYSAPGGVRQKIAATYLFSSDSQFDPSAPIKKARAGFAAFAEWFGKIPITQTFDKDTLQFRSINFDVEKSTDIDVTLFEDDSYSLKVGHKYSLSPITYRGISLSHDVFLTIEFKEGVSFDEVRSCISRIHRLFILCMGFFCELELLDVQFDKSEDWTHCYGNYYRGSDPSQQQIKEMPFPRYRLCDYESNIIRNILYADNDLLNSITLSASLIGRNWKLPTDLESIAASQCLEAVSRINTDTASMEPDEYSRITETIKDSIKDEDVRGWISERMPGNQKGQRRLLTELATRHEVLFNWLFSNPGSYIKAQVTFRNTHAHLRSCENGKDYDFQYWHTRITELVSFLIIWNLLGLPQDQIINAINGSRFMYGVKDKASQLY